MGNLAVTYNLHSYLMRPSNMCLIRLLYCYARLIFQRDLLFVGWLHAGRNINVDAQVDI
jgi:hypothetical protein